MFPISLSGQDDVANEFPTSEFLLLSNEVPDKPVFLHVGSTLSGSNLPQQRIDAYEVSILKFPTLHQCLYMEGDLIDVTKIDWQKIETSQDFEVCAFYVADALNSSELTQLWMQEIGFHSVIQVEMPRIIFRKYGVNEDGLLITSTWSREEAPYPFYADNTISIQTSDSYAVVLAINVTNEGQPLGVQFGATFK